jgi:hypothetical protein
MTEQQTTSTSNSALDLLNDVILLDLLTDSDQLAGLLSNTLASQTIIKSD